jgi:transposase InsO family protein
VKTTVGDKATPCPLDRVNRQFEAPRPNAWWVATPRLPPHGRVLPTSPSSTLSPRIVGWRVSRTAHADFVLDALKQALTTAGPLPVAVSSTTPVEDRNM